MKEITALLAERDQAVAARHFAAITRIDGELYPFEKQAAAAAGEVYVPTFRHLEQLNANKLADLCDAVRAALDSQKVAA